MSSPTDLVVELRHLLISDYQHLRSSMKAAYPNWEESLWADTHISALLDRFPNGQLAVLVNGQVVGCALSLIVDYNAFGDNHTYPQVTGYDTFDTHDPDGDVLYGIEVFVHPDYRGMRLGRRLYDARKELCEQFNLRAIIFGGRLPNYREYADTYTPRQYIEKVKLREIRDPVLNFQLSNDFHVKRVVKGYQPDDEASMEYGVVLEWNNIYYDPKPRLVNTWPSEVRLGLVQWQMRPFPDLDALCQQIEFFANTLGGYQCDFILFPELFNAPLMADFNHLPEAEAIRELASFTEPLRDRFTQYAVAYNTNIITGSMPFVEADGHLYNVGYLCRRDGTWERYEKLHITPSERSTWGMVGGQHLRVFDTDCGRVGVLICYDVEFPELPRLMADDGLQILFVPFLTDTQNAYARVRACAQARAIENECYVAIAGCVGNLPKVENMDIQYAQSAVFTPSDFAFPTGGVKAETTPNTEMTLIADVNLDLLKELHALGAVRNLKDRRLDLYRLQTRATN